MKSDARDWSAVAMPKFRLESKSDPSTALANAHPLLLRQLQAKSRYAYQEPYVLLVAMSVLTTPKNNIPTIPATIIYLYLWLFYNELIMNLMIL